VNQVTEELIKVRDYFIEHGGAVNKLRDNDGRVCMVGAINDCLFTSQYRVSVLMALYSQVPGSFYDIKQDPIVAFNDGGSTFNERVAVFDAAIIASKEAES